MMTKFRTVFFLISRILFVGLSLYYLLNFQSYNVSFRIPPSLRAFQIIDLPFRFLENVGMLITVIPLTIVIMSLIYNENVFLRISSAFFAVSGNLFSVTHLFNQGLLQERFNVGFITIFHEISLQQKEKVFKYFFESKIYDYAKNIQSPTEFAIFVQKDLDFHWNNYIHNLKSMTLAHVEDYANATSQKLYSGYLNHVAVINKKLSHASSSWSWENLPSTGYLIVLGVTSAAVIFGLYWLLREYIFKGAKLIDETAAATVSLSEKQETLSVLSQSTLTSVDTHSSAFLQLSATVTTIQAQLLTLLNQHSSLESHVNENALVLKEFIDKFKSPAFQANLNIIPSNPTNQVHLHEINDILISIETLMLNETNLETVCKLLQKKYDALEERFATLSTNFSTKMEAIESNGEITTVTSPVLRAAVEREMHNTLNVIQSFDPAKVRSEVKDAIRKTTDKISEQMHLHEKNLTEIAREQSSQGKTTAELAKSVNKDQEFVATLFTSLNELNAKFSTMRDDIFLRITRLEQRVTRTWELIQTIHKDNDAITNNILESNDVL